MSGSVIRNAIVDLRRMTLRSAKRRRPPPAIESASTAASTILTLLCGHRLNHMSRAQRGSLAPRSGERVPSRESGEAGEGQQEASSAGGAPVHESLAPHPALAALGAPSPRFAGRGFRAALRPGHVA